MGALGRAVLAAGLATAAFASPAFAQPEVRNAGITRGPDGEVLVDLSLADFITRHDDREARVRSGLSQRITIRVDAIARGTGAVLTTSTRTCEIRFDAWTRAFEVGVRDRGDAAEEHAPMTVATVDGAGEAVVTCLDLVDFAVGNAERFAADPPSHLAIVVELNAADSVTIHQLRQWLGRPDGESGGRETFFGSVVSLFVSRASLRLSVLDEHGPTDGRLEIRVPLDAATP